MCLEPHLKIRHFICSNLIYISEFCDYDRKGESKEIRLNEIRIHSQLLHRIRVFRTIQESWQHDTKSSILKDDNQSRVATFYHKGYLELILFHQLLVMLHWALKLILDSFLERFREKASQFRSTKTIHHLVAILRGSLDFHRIDPCASLLLLSAHSSLMFLLWKNN